MRPPLASTSSRREHGGDDGEGGRDAQWLEAQEALTTRHVLQPIVAQGCSSAPARRCRRCARRRPVSPARLRGVRGPDAGRFFTVHGRDGGWPPDGGWFCSEEGTDWLWEGPCEAGPGRAALTFDGDEPRFVEPAPLSRRAFTRAPRGSSGCAAASPHGTRQVPRSAPARRRAAGARRPADSERAPRGRPARCGSAVAHRRRPHHHPPLLFFESVCCSSTAARRAFHPHCPAASAPGCGGADDAGRPSAGSPGRSGCDRVHSGYWCAARSSGAGCPALLLPSQRHGPLRRQRGGGGDGDGGDGAAGGAARAAAAAATTTTTTTATTTAAAVTATAIASTGSAASWAVVVETWRRPPCWRSRVHQTPAVRSTMLDASRSSV